MTCRLEGALGFDILVGGVTFLDIEGPEKFDLGGVEETVFFIIFDGGDDVETEGEANMGLGPDVLEIPCVKSFLDTLPLTWDVPFSLLAMTFSFLTDLFEKLPCSGSAVDAVDVCDNLDDL